jgi:SAM-dependent methyltransferase|tara:strand:- start:1370 stop:2038 length:669 start_codon:yes stop_codon:yes gene_type:complete
MSINLINSLKLLITKNTLLRDLQINECNKIKVNGLSLEFGTIDRKNKTFSNFIRGQSKFEYSNIKPNKKLNIFYSDLTKKLKIKSNKYNNILLFNVLEHLPEYRIALSQINRILKKKGKIIGSTPFIYQIHGAPKDYFRFTKEFFEFELKKQKFNNIKVQYLGNGPFTACYSLIYPYIRFLPIFSHLVLLICFMLDNILQIFIKTDLKEIFPIGIFFNAQKK